jgi:hypothetical protein
MLSGRSRLSITPLFSATIYATRSTYGETPFIPIADYKKLMGIEKDGCPKFRDFNQRVIKEPVAEINRVSEESLEGHTVGLQALTTIPTA